MSVSLVRIDDRTIHGQTATRWTKGISCGDIIATNDATSTNLVLERVYISAAESQGRKSFIWTLDHFKDVQRKVLTSSHRYSLITKNSLDVKKTLVDVGFVLGDVETIVADPGNDRPGAIKLGNNRSFTSEEGEAFGTISKAGYTIKFQSLPDVEAETWDKYRDKLGF